MMLKKIVLIMLVATVQLSPVAARPFKCWFWPITCPIEGTACWIQCFGPRGRRLEIDPQLALGSGELLMPTQDLWQETLGFLAENAVETRQDLERLVFEEGTQEDGRLGLLEEVVLVSAIWQRLEEHIDTNNDGFLAAEEWTATEWTDIPLPSTPDSFKAVLTRSDDTVGKVFSDFFTMIPEVMAAGLEEESQEPEAEELRRAKSQGSLP